jgi:hypothetical protein
MHPIMKTRSTPEQRQYADQLEDGLTFTGEAGELKVAGELEQNTKLGRYEGMKYPTGQGTK